MTRRPEESDLSLVTVAEGALLAGVEERTVRSWIRRRGLTVWRHAGQPLLLSELEVLEAERATRVSRRGGRPRHVAARDAGS